MASIVNRYTLFVWFLFLFFQELFPQNSLDLQFEFANRLFEKKDYYDAITEYKRLLFFSNGKKYSYLANLMIGKCYKRGAKLDDAVKYFSLAGVNSDGEEEYYNSKIEVIRCNILRRTTDQAILILDNLENDNRFGDKKEDLYYWRGWAYIFSGDWLKAAREFDKINPDHPLKKLCEQTYGEQYSVAFAKIISFIIPGSGQVYTGNYLSGIMSFAWNGALVYLSVNSFLAERAFDGLITTGLFFRFHRGNIQNAEKFALAKNVEISNKTLKYLQDKYPGKKP
jgi:tetratricopeptide (TPR) repeat protein